MRDIVYSLNQYRIIKKYSHKRKNFDYIIFNIKIDGFAHTHIKSKYVAMEIIKNCYHQRTPKTTNLYLLNSHLRVSDNKDYRKYIDSIIKAIEYNVKPQYNYKKYPKI